MNRRSFVGDAKQTARYRSLPPPVWMSSIQTNRFIREPTCHRLSARHAINMVTQTVLSSTCAAFDDEFVIGKYYFDTCVPHKVSGDVYIHYTLNSLYSIVLQYYNINYLPIAVLFTIQKLVQLFGTLLFGLRNWVLRNWMNCSINIIL